MVRCRNFPCRVFAWLLSFFVWYLIFVGVFIGLVNKFHPAWHILILIVWNIVYLLTISSLLAASLTEPASIDPLFQVPNHFLNVPFENREDSYYRQLGEYAIAHPEIHFQYAEIDNIKYPRHCDTCHVFKPNRAHHCRSCGKCILRMDHHCPVIGTCVHFHNHKYFLLFLFWAFMLCLIATSFMIPAVFKIFTTFDHASDTYELISSLVVISGIINAFVCGLALLAFQAHLWIMLRSNETTLEANNEWEKSLYDLGSTCSNFQSIFGNKWYLWLLPIPSTTGDGFTYIQKIQNSDED